MSFHVAIDNKRDSRDLKINSKFQEEIPVITSYWRTSLTNY